MVTHNDDPNNIVANGISDTMNKLHKLEVHFIKSSTQIVLAWATKVNKW
jgi:hypothetical protein